MDAGTPLGSLLLTFFILLWAGILSIAPYLLSGKKIFGKSKRNDREKVKLLEAEAEDLKIKAENYRSEAEDYRNLWLAEIVKRAEFQALLIEEKCNGSRSDDRFSVVEWRAIRKAVHPDRNGCSKEMNDITAKINGMLL